MNTKKHLIIFLAGLTLIGFASGQAIAKKWHGQSDNFCSQTTKSVFQACRFDVLDDFNETNANCINIEDDGDRARCVRDARMAKWEDWKGCREQKNARQEVCALIGEDRYADPLVNPDIVFVDPDDIGEEGGVEPNQYVNMTVGHTYVLRAGEDFEETVIVHVSDEIREAEGAGDDPVLCRVVIDAVMVREEAEEEGEEDEWVVDELTDDYFAQDDEQNVYYCGEISRNYEDDYLDNLDGSFFSGVEHAKAGVLTRQYPEIGQVDRQEYAIAEAEDLVEYLAIGAAPGADEGGQNPNNDAYACGGFGGEGDCLKTLDSSALDPESTEYKYYKSGIGFVLAVSLEDGEFDGEREELVCSGDSLAILSDESCGLEGVEDLLEKLCELSPDAFCVDD